MAVEGIIFDEVHVVGVGSFPYVECVDGKF